MTPVTSTATPHPDASREPAGGGHLKPSEALRKARELITPKGAWAKFEFAYDDLHNRVEFDSPSAICWCASGALNRVQENDDVNSEAHRYLERVLGHAVPVVNDMIETTQERMLDAFDCAVALAEADENARATPSPGPAGAGGAAAGGGAK